MNLLLSLIVLVLVIIYIRKTNDLQRQVAQLEKSLRPPPPQPTTEVAGSPPSTEPLPQAAASAAESAKPAEKKRRHRSRDEWETLIGGKVLNRIGALALIFGVGFFLKHAFDNDWITESVRVLIGVIAGVLLLLAGRRSHRRTLVIFAQGLIGAGIAVLYLSVYASFNYYHLVSQTTAFVLMAVVTLLALLQARSYDSLAVALLGWAGGFATPLLLSTGEARAIGLLTYLAFLTAGLLIVVLKKDDWAVLELLTLIATFFIYFVWFFADYQTADFAVAAVFLVLFWAIFHGMDINRLLRDVRSYATLRAWMPVLLAAAFYFALYALLDDAHPGWRSLATVLVAAAYAATLLALAQRPPAIERAEARFALTAAGLLVVAAAIQFAEHITVALWSLAGLLMVWSGRRWHRRYLWLAAVALFGLAFMVLFGTVEFWRYTPIEEFVLIFNRRAFAALALAAAMIASALIFRRMPEPEAVTLRNLLSLAWCLLLFLLLTVESHDWFAREIAALPRLTAQEEIADLRNLRQLVLSGVWLAYSAVLMAIGLWRELQGLRFLAIALFAVTIFKIFVVDLAFLEKLYRIFSFIGLGLILLAVSYFYQRYKTVLLAGNLRE